MNRMEQSPMCMCIVDIDGIVEFKSNIGAFVGVDIFTVCGRGQSPRNYVTNWLWDEDSHGENEIMIYISVDLNETEMLKQLTPIFESVSHAHELIGRTETLNPIFK